MFGAVGLAVTEEGVPVTDTQFTRYAQITMPNGVVLEIVEPGETVRQLYKAPIVSITVDDLGQARRELEGRKIEFLTPIFDTRKGFGWTVTIHLIPSCNCVNCKMGQM